MPTNIGGVDVWYFPTTKENEAYQDHADVVPEVDLVGIGIWGISRFCTKFRTALGLVASEFICARGRENTPFAESLFLTCCDRLD